ncbi:hypothetical protein [Methanohalobium evestigatum]|nr:hypothetical protein [Methanohalobium evestigatum]
MMFNSSADAVYTNDIDIKADNINFIINESYTGDNALNIRKGLDINNDSSINSSEVDKFKENYTESRKTEYPEYISIDDGNVSIEMESLDMEFENAVGTINKEELRVMTEIKFTIPSEISEGYHKIWIQGHPSIKNMEITLPEDVNLNTIDGLDNIKNSTENGRTVVEGKSITQRSNVGNTTQFGYATSLNIYKKPFYEKMSFIISLFVLLLVLIASASYMIQRNRE